MSTHCPLPWMHLATHPQGDVSLCCRVDFNEGKGMSFDHLPDGGRYFYNLNRDKVDRVMNSGSFKNVRLEMLSGLKPAACAGCYKDEDLGLVSKRMRENEIFNLSQDDLKKMTAPDGSITTKILYAELRLGNLCNLKCRTCNPNSSNKWKAEYGQMQDSLDFVRKYDLNGNFSWAENEEFWSDFLAHALDLKLLYINGGEPTLIKQHWLFLQKLISLGVSKNIDIKYNINTTYLPENVFDIWKQFKSVFVGASVDDLEQRNAYIRQGAKWDVIVKNLALMRDAGIGLAIEQTVSAYNVFYLDEMEKFCSEMKIGYGLNFVYDPDYLSIRCLPDAVKQKIITKLQPTLSSKWFSEVSAHLSDRSDETLWSQFKKYNYYLDKSREESFEQTFPEFYSLLQSEKSI